MRFTCFSLILGGRSRKPNLQIDAVVCIQRSDSSQHISTEQEILLPYGPKSQRSQVCMTQLKMVLSFTDKNRHGARSNKSLPGVPATWLDSFWHRLPTNCVTYTALYAYALQRRRAVKISSTASWSSKLNLERF